MLPELDNYDWEQAFTYAGEGTPQAGAYTEPQVVIHGNCSNAGFTREDVVRIVAMEDGENDGPAWIGVFELRDGRYAYLEAGCDYTGWDCRAGGFSQVASALETLARYGVGVSARKRLDMALPEDEV